MDNTLEECQYAERSLSSSVPTSSYAFLNHSAVTLPNNLPPNVDDKPLARQKRKRTSPEDQAILEAAYSRDPKPDKAARVELLKQVALGEKEVQIWFQNRRQSSRRKSRPLLPHEVAQYQLLRSGAACKVPSSEFPSSCTVDDDNDASNLTSSGKAAGEYESDYQPAALDGTSIAASMLPQADYVPLAGTRIAGPSGSIGCHTLQPLQVPHAQVPGRPAAAPTKHHHDASVPFKYLANRRSLPSLHPISSAVQNSPVYGQVTDVSDAERHPQSSTSLVRLSMTSEGNAKVVNKDASEPSPPRPAQVLDMGLGTSQSGGQMKNDLSKLPSLKPAKSLQRSSSGRSRDSRAWEFWCDKDSRGELEDKAEKDASGSAANAIGLLRSASGRSILGSIPTKRNSALSRQQPTTFQKRPKIDTTRPSLHKSSTSLGRLQADQHDNPASLMKPVPKLQHSMSAASAWISGNDSDKENWSPEVKPQAVEHSSENFDPETNSELSAFMRSGRKSNSTPREEDLDCVQGLLSLSQGNWR